mmetsp:Transcript_58205/g.125840  ORF Transcript_58205/g.125840 Transcript_58205/m.125840 type:complete len:260 (+) Transcript_58205:1127-1906(+)
MDDVLFLRGCPCPVLARLAESLRREAASESDGRSRAGEGTSAGDGTRLAGDSGISNGGAAAAERLVSAKLSRRYPIAEGFVLGPEVGVAAAAELPEQRKALREICSSRSMALRSTSSIIGCRSDSTRWPSCLGRKPPPRCLDRIRCATARPEGGRLRLLNMSKTLDPLRLELHSPALVKTARGEFSLLLGACPVQTILDQTADARDRTLPRGRESSLGWRASSQLFRRDDLEAGMTTNSPGVPADGIMARSTRLLLPSK